MFDVPVVAPELKAGQDSWDRADKLSPARHIKRHYDLSFILFLTTSWDNTETKQNKTKELWIILIRALVLNKSVMQNKLSLDHLLEELTGVPWTGKGWLDFFPLCTLLSPAVLKGSYLLPAIWEQALSSFQHWQ